MSDESYVFDVPGEKTIDEMLAEARRKASAPELAPRPEGIERRCQHIVDGLRRCGSTFIVKTEKNRQRYCSRLHKELAKRARQRSRRQADAVRRIGLDPGN